MNAQTTFLPDDALPLLALGTVAVVCGAIAVLAGATRLTARTPPPVNGIAGSRSPALHRRMRG